MRNLFTVARRRRNPAGEDDGDRRFRRIVRINVIYVLAVGLYGLSTGEPYWREVGHAPWVYDALFWVGLVVNGPSGFAADWLAFVSLHRHSEARFVLQYMLWAALLWAQWRIYRRVAGWTCRRPKRVWALIVVGLLVFIVGSIVALEAWVFGHRNRGDAFIDAYFWFVRVVGLACSGLVLIFSRGLACPWRLPESNRGTGRSAGSDGVPG